ncbi:MAG: PEP/pyruvate-binding domain-containing protein, partial [Cyanobacteria bacterium J06649_11]
DKLAPFVVFLDVFSQTAAGKIGGKAAGLGVLYEKTTYVPPCFSVTSNAFEYFCEENSIDLCLTDLSNQDKIFDYYNNLVLKILEGNFPLPLANAINASLDKLVLKAPATVRNGFSVRSSFQTESTMKLPSPGIYESAIQVEISDVLNSIKAVWSSFFSSEGIKYRLLNEVTLSGVNLGVIVQEYIDGSKGGILSTLEPSQKDPAKILIESISGNPSRILNDNEKPSRYVINKVDLSISLEDLVEGESLERREIEVLSSHAKKLEIQLNSPLELEWIMNDSGQAYFLQLRKLPIPRRISQATGFVMDSNQNQLKSGKIKPFMSSAVVKTNKIPYHIITPKAFYVYKENGKNIPTELLIELRSLSNKYLQKGEVSFRSTYWSGLHSSDMLPAFPVIQNLEKCIDSIKDYWNFIIDNHLDDYSAEVALMIGNWIQIESSIVAVANRENQIIFNAVFGYLEGLELNLHDVYIVDLPSQRITSKRIPEKTVFFNRKIGEVEQLTEEKRSEQVVSDQQIVKISKKIHKIYQQLGPSRIEIIIPSKMQQNLGEEIFWQIDKVYSTSDYDSSYYRVVKVSSENPNIINVKTTLYRIQSSQDLEKYHHLEEGMNISFLLDYDERLYRNKSFMLAIGEFCKNRGINIIIQGSLLSHFASGLREFGIRVYNINETLTHIRNNTKIILEKNEY